MRSFMICSAHQVLLGSLNPGDERVRACSMQEGFDGGIQKKIDHLTDLSVDGKVIVK
jgi:hypothetical protein